VASCGLGHAHFPARILNIEEPPSGTWDCQPLIDLGVGWGASSLQLWFPRVVKVARLSRPGFGAAVALALALMCVARAVAASTTPMTGMVDASATAAVTAAPAFAVGAYTGGTVGDVVREVASPVASVMSPLMSSMWDSACVRDVSECARLQRRTRSGEAHVIRGPRVRRVLLIVHIAVSVGWMGAAAASSSPCYWSSSW